MSNILRRPMFRMGGQVNSQGTGIMSGLEPRQNYATAGPVLSYADQIKKQKRIQDILKTDFKTAEQFGKEYDTYVEGLEPSILYGVEEFGPGTYGESLEEKYKIASSPEAKKSYVAEKLAEQQKLIDEAKSLGAEQQLPKLVQQTDTPKQTTKKPTKPLLPGTGDGPGTVKELEESDLKTIYKDLLPLFEKELGPEEDEYRRQKYMQLAKFGLGLLAQPGGSLVEAIGRAGEKPLAGLEATAAREAQARRAPRVAALEAALKQAEPGKYGQAVRDLKKLGISEARAIEIATQSGTATKQRTYEGVVENLQNSLSEQGIVTDKSAARGTAKDLLKAEGLGVKTYEFEKFPKEGSPQEGKYYIMENGRSGRFYKGQLIQPGEKGFTGELPE